MHTNHLAALLAAPGKSAAPPRPATHVAILVTAAEGAAMLRVSLRQFRALKDKLPAPVALGAKSCRWRVVDLEQWVSGLQAKTERPEPPRLAEGRMRRQAAAKTAKQAEAA